MALENDDAIRRLLVGCPRPQLAEGFARELMRRVEQQELDHARQRGVGTRLVLGAYWLAALAASAWILRQGPLPEWAAALLWCAALVLVPAGYAFALWSRPEALAGRERS
jgi:hypothetical protein